MPPTKDLNDCQTTSEVLTWLCGVAPCKRTTERCAAALARVEMLSIPEASHFYDADNWEYTADHIRYVMEDMPEGEVVKVGRLAKLSSVWAVNLRGANGFMDVLTSPSEDELKVLIEQHNKENPDE